MHGNQIIAATPDASTSGIGLVRRGEAFSSSRAPTIAKPSRRALGLPDTVLSSMRMETPYRWPHRASRTWFLSRHAILQLPCRAALSFEELAPVSKEFQTEAPPRVSLCANPYRPACFCVATGGEPTRAPVHLKRRLLAILAANVVGSERLPERDKPTASCAPERSPPKGSRSILASRGPTPCALGCAVSPSASVRTGPRGSSRSGRTCARSWSST